MLNVETAGTVVTLTIDRPEVRNAFNAELIKALSEAFSSLSARVVILTGAGDAFCAGGDLAWMRAAAGYTQEENYEDAFRLAELFRQMVEFPGYVIARVNGAAFGGGAGLVAACDAAVAVEGAQFAFSEVRLGLVPATISPYVIPKIGHSQARALFGSGEAFGATRALAIGLVHDVTSPEELDRSVQRRVKTVLSAGPQAVAAAKRLAQGAPLTNEAAARLLAETRAGDEAKEGISAFLEKRPANFVEGR